MVTIRKHLLSGSAALAIAASCFSSVQAQQLDEIIVTSTLREKSVQDIPITVAVLGAQQIEKADIHGADGIANHVPGLHYANFAPGQTLFAMRGVGSFDDGAGLDNSVALFLDGVYVGRGAGVNFDMFDLERIEVLKGPQGALFGRNTIGGAISVVTAKPADEFAAKIAVTGGNEGIFRLQGLITGPISENLSAKLVVSHRRHDGFVRNVLLGKSVNDEDRTSIRGQIKLDAGNSEWVVSADWMQDETEDNGRFLYVNNPNGADNLAIATGFGSGRSNPQTTAEPLEGFNNRESKGISLNGEIVFDNGTLTTITSYREVDTDWEMPSVGSPLGPSLNAIPGRFGIGVIDDIEEQINTFSQELRWTSNTGGDLEYVVGAYFFTEDTDRPEQFRLDLNTVQGGQVTIGNEFTRTQNESTSYALYGQAQWDFAEQWSLLVGGRYSHDEKDYTAIAVNCGNSEAVRAAAGFPNFPNCQGVGGSLRIIAETFERSAKVSFDDFSPMASIQYRPNEDVMLFATISTGYKSGGFAGSQGVAAAATTPVKAEGVTSYEVGLKSTLAGGSVRFNATGFYMDYKDLQIVRFGPVPGSAFGSFLTTNIGSADIYGAEVELDWAVTDQFTLSGSYAFLDTEANELVINGTDFSGLDLRQAPKNSFSFTADYDMPLENGMGDVNFNANLNHTDKSHNDFATAAQTLSEAKTLLDAQVSWTTASGKYKVALWGKNITDKNYVAHSYFIGPGTIGIWGAPRTYGVTATANF
jgi:iron complex outermembrane receptor protein